MSADVTTPVSMPTPKPAVQEHWIKKIFKGALLAIPVAIYLLLGFIFYFGPKLFFKRGIPWLQANLIRLSAWAKPVLRNSLIKFVDFIIHWILRVAQVFIFLKTKVTLYAYPLLSRIWDLWIRFLTRLTNTISHVIRNVLIRPLQAFTAWFRKTQWPRILSALTRGANSTLQTIVALHARCLAFAARLRALGSSIAIKGRILAVKLRTVVRAMSLYLKETVLPAIDHFFERGILYVVHQCELVLPRIVLAVYHTLAPLYHRVVSFNTDVLLPLLRRLGAFVRVTVPQLIRRARTALVHLWTNTIVVAATKLRAYMIHLASVCKAQAITLAQRIWAASVWSYRHTVVPFYLTVVVPFVTRVRDLAKLVLRWILNKAIILCRTIYAGAVWSYHNTLLPLALRLRAAARFTIHSVIVPLWVLVKTNGRRFIAFFVTLAVRLWTVIRSRAGQVMTWIWTTGKALFINVILPALRGGRVRKWIQSTAIPLVQQVLLPVRQISASVLVKLRAFLAALWLTTHQQSVHFIKVTLPMLTTQVRAASAAFAVNYVQPTVGAAKSTVAWVIQTGNSVAAKFGSKS